MEDWMDTEQRPRQGIDMSAKAAIVSSSAVVRAEEPVMAEGFVNAGPRNACATQIIHGKNSMSANNQITATRSNPGEATASANGEAAKEPLQLRRASEVEAANDADSPLGSTVAWVRKFLARPHPDLGRAGPVCPFTPMALELDTMWLIEVLESTPDPLRMQDVIENCRKLFMETEPREGPLSINKVIMVVFSGMSADDAPWIDALQTKLKPNFVDVGLMLGEFHSKNETPGLRNEHFRPLRSPIPMLVMRHMVESDLPFLKRETDIPEVRISYLRSYLRRLGAGIRRNYFDQAVDALVDAEIELRGGAGTGAAQ